MLTAARAFLNGTATTTTEQPTYTREMAAVPTPPTLASEPVLASPYEPYPYQKQGAALLHEIFDDGARQNVLVNSPTGSGKSYLIHYAAALAERHKAKVVVTVPLVALAEQLYSDLKRVVPPQSLGIFTGPSRANEEEARVVVCTYEVALIQMNNDPSWFGEDVLVVDEVHSIATERGHVLESLLVHENFNLNCLALSGTIPNAVALSEALGTNGDRPTFVIGMKKRPIALEFKVDLGYGPLRPISAKALDEWRKLSEDRMEFKAERPSYKAIETKLVRAVYQIKNDGLLPAMVVAFSCRQLNRMAESLRAVDFELDKAERWRINVLFMNLKRHVGDEDYGLFHEMESLAKRGILVYHSQMPKHYLETGALMAKQGLARVILATSALSTGINLPVSTILLTKTTMPPKFEPMTPSLFHQICGRCGRPGVSKTGTVVLCDWERAALDDWRGLLLSKPAPVRGKGVVNVPSILRALQYGSVDAERALCASPFSADPARARVLTGLERELANFPSPVVQQVFSFLELSAIVSSFSAKYLDLNRWKPGKTKVLLDAGYPRLRPVEHTFLAWEPSDRKSSFTVVEEKDAIMQTNWVIDADSPLPKKTPMDVFDARQRVRDLVAIVSEGPPRTTDDAFDLAEAMREVKTRFPDAFGPVFRHLLAYLRKFGYVDGLVVTKKGRFAQSLVGVECPISFAECYYRNALPTTDAALFAATVAVFLTARRSDEGAGGESIVRAVCEDVGLFSPSFRFFHPVKEWAEGATMLSIVRKHSVPIGTFSKLINRVEQTLAHLKDTIPISVLAGKKIRHGLPFKPSIHLIK